MKIKLLMPVLAAFLGAYLLTGILRADHLPVVNGDFENGTLDGWTSFLTPNGMQMSDPSVVDFDMNGDEFISSVAQFRLGTKDDEYGGGGIYQTIHLSEGVYTVSAEIGVSDTGSIVGVDKPGLFELLVDGVVADSHEFSLVTPSQTLVANLAINAENPYEIRLRITRMYSPSSKLLQLVDNVAVTMVSGEPLAGRSTATGGGHCQTPDSVKALLPTDLPTSLESALFTNLDAATDALELGRDENAINQLSAFINHVDSQSGKEISPEDADALINCAQDAIEHFLSS